MGMGAQQPGQQPGQQPQVPPQGGKGGGAPIPPQGGKGGGAPIPGGLQQQQPMQSGLNAQPGSWNIGPQNYTPQQGWNITPPTQQTQLPPQGGKARPPGLSTYADPYRPQQPPPPPQGGYNPPGDGYARRQERMAERMARRDDRGGNGQGYGLRQLMDQPPPMQPMAQTQPMQVPGVPRTISGFDPGFR